MRQLLLLLTLALGFLLGPSAALARESTDEAALSKLEARIRAGELGNVHAAIITQRGTTRAEWYFAGSDERRGAQLGVVQFTPETLHDARSVTKSIVSVLFGIALSDGVIGDLDQPVLDYFPEYPDLRTPERLQIRLRHLLSMTSGLHWDERTFPYTDRRNSETAMDLAQDRLRHILSQPIDTKPGEKWAYSGGDVALIAEVISRVTKTPIDVYAERKLFQPLQISEVDWVKDAKGVPIAASGLRLRPRDMAKIGEMMLQRGRWKDAQIVPAAWVDVSTSRQAQLSRDLKCGWQYGYYWWLGTICDREHDRPYFFASGNGGQLIWVNPSLELVVVTTAGAYNSKDPSMEIVLTAAKAARSPAW